MTQPADQQPAPVPMAKQAGPVQSRWAWTEPAVWTERMLTALEQRVKGGVWFTLIDKVGSERNLQAAFTKVARNAGAAGVDHVSVTEFEQRLDSNLRELVKGLREDSYRPQAVRRVHIPKPGSQETRPLGIPTVRDRVVQGAVRHVLEPIFEREFADHSYGFRPNRGCKDALRRVDELLKAGYVHVVDADLKSYFDSIPHERLLQRVGERVADGRVLRLVESFLKAGIFDGLEEWTPEAGAPQGAVLSPLLSNIYLNPLDHLLAQHGLEMVRYADDFVILCRSDAEAQRALALVQQWTAEAGLMLHPTKTRIVDARTTRFDFLGYRFERGLKFPRAKSLAKLKDTVRAKTKRTDGRSLAVIVADLNRTLRGWFGYFKHSHRTEFPSLDGWIRRRLRRLLLKRRGQDGSGRSRHVHQLWPNAYFAAHGLYSLATAHRLACQSPLG
jgi:RNA-directed DNA polymerase